MSLPPFILSRIPDLPADSGPNRGDPPPADLGSSFKAAAAVTRHHAKTFFFASRFLPRPIAAEAYAVYAYCRTVDDLIDEHTGEENPPDREALLAENRKLLSGDHPAAFAPGFHWTCRKRGIPLSLLDDLVEGCSRDRNRVRIRDRDDLFEYCYLVASVVGLMMSRVFGISDKEAYPHAVEMGLAMQLTNILRDVREDYERDRIYLPADELEARSLSVEDLLAEGPSKEWRTYLGELVSCARTFYQSAEKGLPAIVDKRGRRTARVMGRVYGGILHEIEKAGYDVRDRHHVGLFRKCRLAFF